MSRIIENVGMLDLTQATEETVTSIERIGNVGLVIYRAETAHLLTLLKTQAISARRLKSPRDIVITAARRGWTRNIFSSWSDRTAYSLTARSSSIREYRLKHSRTARRTWWSTVRFMLPGIWPRRYLCTPQSGRRQRGDSRLRIRTQVRVRESAVEQCISLRRRAYGAGPERHGSSG